MSSTSTPMSTPSKQRETEHHSPHYLSPSINESQRKREATSNLVHKINQMESFYVSKIKSLEQRVIELEDENESLRNQLSRQDKVVSSLKLELQSNREVLESQINSFEKSVMRKVVEEADECYITIQEAKIKLQNQLSIERRLRQTLQVQIKQIQDQKEHLNQFYKHVVENHRRLLKADIERTKESIKTHDSEEIKAHEFCLSKSKKKKGKEQPKH